MNPEELNHKLNRIFVAVMDVNLKLDEMENEKKKKDARNEKELCEMRLREAQYFEDNMWSNRERAVEEFNRRFEEDVEEL